MLDWLISHLGADRQPGSRRTDISTVGWFLSRAMTHKDEMRHTVFKHGHIGLLFCLFCLPIFIIKCETSYTCLSRVLNMFACILLDLLCASCQFVFLRFHQISLFLIALFFCVTTCLILMSSVLSGVTHITHTLSSLPLVWLLFPPLSFTPVSHCFLYEVCSPSLLSFQ